MKNSVLLTITMLLTMLLISSAVLAERIPSNNDESKTDQSPITDQDKDALNMTERLYADGNLPESGTMNTPMGNDKMAMDKGKMMEHENLRVAMRMLWDEHVTYTRNYIISALAKAPDAPAVAERLMKNQDDIGNAIAPFYGEAAGKKLAMLLKEHIGIAAEVVGDAMSGDSEKLGISSKKWTTNADEIAAFLAGANPNWDKAKLMDMLHMHLTLTTNEVTSRLAKNWVKDIEAYDMGHAHMMMFADYLTNGIAMQFPDKMMKLEK